MIDSSAELWLIFRSDKHDGLEKKDNDDTRINVLIGDTGKEQTAMPNKKLHRIVRTRLTVALLSCILSLHTSSVAAKSHSSTDSTTIEPPNYNVRFSVLSIGIAGNPEMSELVRYGLGYGRWLFTLTGFKSLEFEREGVNYVFDTFLPLRVAYHPIYHEAPRTDDVPFMRAFVTMEVFGEGMFWKGKDSEPKGMGFIAGTRLSLGAMSLTLELEPGYFFATKRYQRSNCNQSVNTEPPGCSLEHIDFSGFYFHVGIVLFDYIIAGEKLREVPIYNSATLRPHLVFNIAFQDQNGNNILEAEESASIVGYLHNTGRSKAQDVTLRVSASGACGVNLLPEISIGSLEPGESRAIQLPITTSDALGDGSVDLVVLARERFGYDANNIVFTVATSAFDPPRLQLPQTTVDDDQTGDQYGNANSRIEPGELIEATSIIQSTGAGVARDVRVSCLRESGSIPSGTSLHNNPLFEELLEKYDKK